MAALAAVLTACALALAAPAGASAFGPLFSFGSMGAGAGQFSAPDGIAIGAGGSLYLADFANNRIDAFSSEGVFVRAFGKGVNAKDGSSSCTPASGCGEGIGDASQQSIFHPADVAIGADGLLYVAENGNGRVDVYAPSGEFISSFGKQGDEAGSMLHPGALAFGSTDLLYVADTDNNRVDAFTSAGAFRFAFGSEVNPTDGSDVCEASCRRGRISGVAGAIDLPAGVVGIPGGLIAVSDTGNNRVDVYDGIGNFRYAFGKRVDLARGADVCTGLNGCRAGLPDASAGALSLPTGIDVSAGGKLLVADHLDNRFVEYGVDGSFLRGFGEGVLDGSRTFQVCSAATDCRIGLATPVPGAVRMPFGVAADGRGGVYVVSDGADLTRVTRFGEPEAPKPDPPKPPNATPPSGKPSNRFRLGRLSLNRRQGTATLTVAVPGSGSLLLNGRGIRRVRSSATGEATVKLPVRPVGRAKARLLATGRATASATVTFVPSGGDPGTMSRRLALRKVPPGRP